MKFFQSLLFVTATLFVGCDVVSSGDPISTDQIDTDQARMVNLGEGSLPSDAEEFALLLHNNSSKMWRAAEFTIEGISSFLDCRLDDTITIFSDGTYEYDGGENLCGGEDNQSERSGNWDFNAQDALLIFEPGTSMEASVTVVTLENGLLTFQGIYESTLFGVFDIEGRYTSDQL